MSLSGKKQILLIEPNEEKRLELIKKLSKYEVTAIGAVHLVTKESISEKAGGQLYYLKNLYFAIIANVAFAGKVADIMNIGVPCLCYDPANLSVIEEWCVAKEQAQ